MSKVGMQITIAWHLMAFCQTPQLGVALFGLNGLLLVLMELLLMAELWEVDEPMVELVASCN